MVICMDALCGVLFLLCYDGLMLAVLHILLLYCCKKLRRQTLCSDRRRFALRNREQGGRFYRNVLKIHRWKHRMPQYIGREGFSKAKLEKRLTPAYLEQFLQETCRGEWYHTAALSGIVILFAINPLWLAGCIAFPMALIHGGCIAIQRYNRGRLLAVCNKKYRSPAKDCGIEISSDYP